MYRIILLFLISFLSVPVFATRTVVTQTPINNPYYGAYYGGDYYPNRRMHRTNSSVFNDINDLEKYAFNKNFVRDNDNTRLERLENLAFGAIQEGDIYTRYDNVRDAILSRPKQNYKTSLLRNINDYLSGQMTGFTPSINQPSFSNYPYGRSTSTEYVTPWGKGYRNNQYGMGSGMGIHLLD